MAVILFDRPSIVIAIKSIAVGPVRLQAVAVFPSPDVFVIIHFFFVFVPNIFVGIGIFSSVCLENEILINLVEKLEYHNFLNEILALIRRSGLPTLSKIVAISLKLYRLLFLPFFDQITWVDIAKAEIDFSL
jgi:hypothetical protein